MTFFYFQFTKEIKETPDDSNRQPNLRTTGLHLPDRNQSFINEAIEDTWWKNMLWMYSNRHSGIHSQSQAGMLEKQLSLAGFWAPTSLHPKNMFIQVNCAASEFWAKREKRCLQRTTLTHMGVKEHRAFSSCARLPYTRVLITAV